MRSLECLSFLERVELCSSFRRKCTLTAGGCWLWHSTVNGRGYPVFWNGHRAVSARRMARFLFCDAPDLSARLFPSCGDARCVSPAHLLALSSVQVGYLARVLRQGGALGAP